ncbi:MAG TPA: SRPBCC family protein [Solirubrobacteraceae bacterium]|jgi:hypothetical protein|nr:SRPBCC family protein [Solirubrobacteraceae bacterium]
MSLKRAETRSVAIAAGPAVVHGYLSEGANLSEWAPGFAPRVRPSGTHWLVVRDELEFLLDVRSQPLAGTADFLAAGDHARGLFARVLPNGEGSELVCTIMFTPDTPADVIEAQLITLETELAAVRRACE